MTDTGVTLKDEKKDRRFLFGSLAVVIVLLLIGILRHEMWRDELQAWCLARDSASLLDVSKHLLYEGHPIAWYLPLFLLTRVTHDPLVMQVLNIALITATCALVLVKAPFAKWQRAVFCFGYFPLFEYGIISRSYSLELLTIIAFCCMFKQRAQHPYRLFACLAVLAAINAYGLMIAFAFLATLIVDYWLSRSIKPLPVVAIIGGSCLIIASAGLTVWQMSAPSDGYHGEMSAIKEEQPKRLFKALRAVPIAYAPIPNVSEKHFWNTDLVSKIENEPITYALIFSIVLFCLLALCTKPTACFLYAIGTSGLIFFSYTHLLGGLRQQGHLFLILFCSLWLANLVSGYNFGPAWLRKISDDKVRSAALSIILVIQMVAGVYAYAQDLARPFSSAKLVARFIKQKHLQDMLIIGSNDHEITSVSGYLDRKIYCPESRSYTGFVINNTSRHNIEFAELSKESRAVMEQRHVNEALLILNYQLGAIPDGFTVECLNIFDKSIQSDEKFYLYKITRVDKAVAK